MHFDSNDQYDYMTDDIESKLDQMLNKSEDFVVSEEVLYRIFWSCTLNELNACKSNWEENHWKQDFERTQNEFTISNISSIIVCENRLTAFDSFVTQMNTIYDQYTTMLSDNMHYLQAEEAKHTLLYNANIKDFELNAKTGWFTSKINRLWFDHLEPLELERLFIKNTEYRYISNINKDLSKVLQNVLLSWRSSQESIVSWLVTDWPQQVWNLVWGLKHIT